MPTLDELQGATGSLHDALAAGIADISQQTTVEFTTYQKVVLPLDGYVYWLRTGSFEQTGAIHFMAERQQEETETRARNTVIFTTQELVQSLNTEDTQILAIGEISGQRYAFGRHGWYFPQAGVWHYQGDGIPAAMAVQIIDDPSQLPTEPIVSNSLPAWLELVSYDPVWISWPIERNPHITLYPSYLVPDNLQPPYGVVHIEPSRIEALQSTAMWTRSTFSHYQLTRETIRVTLYGCNNNTAADFMDLVEQYSLDTDAFGILNMPTIRDGKRPWPEGMVIAQLKTIEFEVTYTQTRINEVARQLITSATVAVVPEALSRTAGTLGAEAGIQAGRLFVSAGASGHIDGSGGLQARTIANVVAGTKTNADAGFSSYSNVVGILAAKISGQAGVSAYIRPQGMGAQVAGIGGIQGAASVNVPGQAPSLGGVGSTAAKSQIVARAAAEDDATAGITSRLQTVERAAAQSDAAGGITGRPIVLRAISAKIDASAAVVGAAH